MAGVSLFDNEERYDYQAMLDELIEELEVADIELGPEAEQVGVKSVEDVTNMLHQLREAQARFAEVPNVQKINKKDFKARDLTVPPDIDKWMKTHNFYQMRVPVILRPIVGWGFWRLQCAVRFTAEQHPQTHDIYPEHRWHEVLKAEGNLNIGLDAGLRFNVGLDETELVYANLSGQAAAHGGLAAAGDGNVVVNLFNVIVQRPIIDTRGEDTNEASWFIEGYKYVQEGEPYLGVVLRVPKDVDRLQAYGGLIANHRFNVAGAHLTDWPWANFRDALKSFLQKGLPIDDERQWDIVLPS